MNKNVLKWAPPIIIGLLMAGSPLRAQAAPVKHKHSQPALMQENKAAPARATYTSASPPCLTARRKLWTDEGWIVRRVNSCR